MTLGELDEMEYEIFREEWYKGGFGGLVLGGLIAIAIVVAVFFLSL